MFNCNGCHSEHDEAKKLHVAQAELVSIASKYNSVILTLKVYFPTQTLFGPRLYSLAVCPVLRNIDGYAFTYSTP